MLKLPSKEKNMISMLCSIWGDFSDWITNAWTDTTFYIVVSILAICGLLFLSVFVKKSYNYNKDDKIKWGQLVLAILFIAEVVVLCVAKFA